METGLESEEICAEQAKRMLPINSAANMGGQQCLLPFCNTEAEAQRGELAYSMSQNCDSTHRFEPEPQILTWMFY